MNFCCCSNVLDIGVINVEKAKRVCMYNCMHLLQPMQFTWNERKNRANIQKHGIDFEDAKELFFNNYVDNLDDRKNYGEDRMVAVGYVQGYPLVVVYTQPDPSTIHLVSARVALPHEEQKLLVSLSMINRSGKSLRLLRKRTRLRSKKKQDYGKPNE